MKYGALFVFETMRKRELGKKDLGTEELQRRFEAVEERGMCDQASPGCNFEILPVMKPDTSIYIYCLLVLLPSTK